MMSRQTIECQINLNQLNFTLNDFFKKKEKITTNLEPFNIEDSVNKAYLDTELSKVEGH